MRPSALGGGLANFDDVYGGGQPPGGLWPTRRARACGRRLRGPPNRRLPPCPESAVCPERTPAPSPRPTAAERVRRGARPVAGGARRPAGRHRAGGRGPAGGGGAAPQRGARGAQRVGSGPVEGVVWLWPRPCKPGGCQCRMQPSAFRPSPFCCTPSAFDSLK